jgi:hypothetical protein
MKKLISAILAGRLLVILLALLAIFHVLIILQIVPLGSAWGGQVSNSSADLLVLELLALVVILMFALVVKAKLNLVRRGKRGKAIDLGLWLMAVYFLLNTVGNLLSRVALESFLFAPLALIMTLLAIRLVLEKQSSQTW